ncbi:MAG: helix-turn-helix domain-containing protein [Gammaproteobacteria bacterium]|jgi:transcriptional regulator with XRE-family HTH domain|uniref:Helix-turn-helix n=1 Tax=Marinomonas polaris DSM 16579 TaxID=1122206 RepID=A0A1M5IBU2_9GAMM|nr:MULTISPECIES: helix-turn-helix transcriptional regulator [Marinomonas]MBU1297382.1 helix-turn-helix domain-containing protein [Gammaproteobacteria bacterium]MBU1466693.1 helix-turn-helix domain-containing protein [Gammaproteobacteria bacterium]MBU2021594.1 helix-turn-helix domain-containing protein [Gammaproteobacteria bacterium]MBU2236825.1 helix-turn-helix domain-containing protein [Gammaproteobacteria bacterium]MBU2320406.1 helix-turn-helix domain-containing protein [Gammaproteobacteria |tara:strand:+ start:2812 stop:3210 length:399 start_codon:yes stop_codon:yes gene_type:complete
MNIGHVIKILRIQRKMTQEQIALEADMATSNVSRIEKGLRQPSQKVLQKLAKALNTKPSVLYAASEQPITNISDFLEQEGNDEKKEENINQLLLNHDTQVALKLFSELTPDNKSLLLEQLKTLHRWQTKLGQ